MITTCTDCGSLYDAGSNEQANEPRRWCWSCSVDRGLTLPFCACGRRWNECDGSRKLCAKRGTARSVTAPRLYGYPPGWPLCPGCGLPALDGHITCGDVRCDEGGRR